MPVRPPSSFFTAGNESSRDAIGAHRASVRHDAVSGRAYAVEFGELGTRRVDSAATRSLISRGSQVANRHAWMTLRGRAKAESGRDAITVGLL